MKNTVPDLSAFVSIRGSLEQLDLHNKSSEVCIKTRSLSAPLAFKGQVTEQITVKWSITAGSARDHR